MVLRPACLLNLPALDRQQHNTRLMTIETVGSQGQVPTTNYAKKEAIKRSDLPRDYLAIQ